MRAQDTGTQENLLRKSLKSFDTGSEKKLKEFQYWAGKAVLKKNVHLWDVFYLYQLKHITYK